MNTKVDVTMTATLRPSIIEQTLDSFSKNLFFENPDRYKLIINIDPVGESIKIKHIIRICMKYFKEVDFNIPKYPSFPKAVIWTWSKVSAPYVFHLEDDWLMTRQVKIKHLIEIMNENKNLASLRFSKYKIENKDRIRMFNAIYDYNKQGFYVSLDKRRQFGLNPCLIRSEFVKESYPRMLDTINPEKQFRYGNKHMNDIIMKWDYAIYGQPGTKALVVDNGVNWKEGNKFKKPDKSTFLVWEKK